jgi:hypothetical protein
VAFSVADRIARMSTIVAASCALAAASSRAQIPLGPNTRELISVNTDPEQYLRVLQDVGLVQPYPWTSREFGPLELQSLIPTDTAHPWCARVRRLPYAFSDFYWLAPDAQGIYNSTFPYGFNDGALWAGKGLTTAAQAGFAGHVWRLSFTGEPMVFRAENASFPLLPNGQTGRLAFADGVNPLIIDQPQRFGNSPYQRFDPGQTTLRLDLPVVALGLSTANQSWGPARDNPIILGNNAAGFPHVFLASSTPLGVKVAKVYGRLQWGRLDQSSFAVRQDSDTKRLMTGVVASIMPAGLENLEIGGARFFESVWPGGVPLSKLLEPLQGFFGSEPNNNAATAVNQLASLFVRWTFPQSGFELYGEFGRDDRNLDLRDLLQEPDHESSYLFGFQKVVRRGQTGMFVVRSEVLNARISPLVLDRPQSPFYVHTQIVQGHTELGQILGAFGAYGGGAAEVAVDHYQPDGRWTVSYTRTIRYAPPPGSTTLLNPDVIHAIDGEWLLFRRRFDYLAGLTALDELNRNFSGNAAGLRVRIGVRSTW